MGLRTNGQDLKITRGRNKALNGPVQAETSLEGMNLKDCMGLSFATMLLACTTVSDPPAPVPVDRIYGVTIDTIERIR